MTFRNFIGETRMKPSAPGIAVPAPSKPPVPAAKPKAPELKPTDHVLHSHEGSEPLDLGPLESSESRFFLDDEKRLLLDDEDQDVPGAENERRFLLDLDISMHRVFSGSFAKGGRYYGSDVQRLPKELRGRVVIDGESTVELDYDAMHPRMLYHMEGLEAPPDPYEIQGVRNLRAQTKLLCLISLNATGKGQTMRAFASALRDAGLAMPEGVTAADLAMHFERQHEPISRWFYTGCGLMLQNKDSAIAERVMHTFAKDGRPIACVHDSFLVRERDRDLLRSTMREAYRKFMHGFEPVIR